ncbi:MAG: hypothetical protein H5T69_13420, partial [Chloroflexi bacterium]|nr:hypothetical protein [Chloroflexota bacterium]
MAVVVVFPDDVFTSCVEFVAPDIESTELLMRAGLALVYTAAPAGGNVMCSINGVGCSMPIPLNNCICQCPSEDNCTLWYHYYFRDGHWESVGPLTGNVNLVDGDIDAWVWGTADDQPPDLLYEEICPPF